MGWLTTVVIADCFVNARTATAATDARQQRLNDMNRSTLVALLLTISSGTSFVFQSPTLHAARGVTTLTRASSDDGIETNLGVSRREAVFGAAITSLSLSSGVLLGAAAPAMAKGGPATPQELARIRDGYTRIVNFLDNFDKETTVSTRPNQFPASALLGCSGSLSYTNTESALLASLTVDVTR